MCSGILFTRLKGNVVKFTTVLQRPSKVMGLDRLD